MAYINDSQETNNLFDKKNIEQDFFGDSAYSGQKQNAIVAKNKIVNKVYEKGYRAKPLTDEQKVNNTEKSRIRARVENVFRFMENSMNSMKIKCIGFKRT